MLQIEFQVTYDLSIQGLSFETGSRGIPVVLVAPTRCNSFTTVHGNRAAKLAASEFPGTFLMANVGGNRSWGWNKSETIQNDIKSSQK